MNNQLSLSLSEQSFSLIAAFSAVRKLLPKYSPNQLLEFDKGYLKYSSVYVDFVNNLRNGMRNTMVPEILRPVFDENYNSYHQKILPLLEEAKELNDMENQSSLSLFEQSFSLIAAFSAARKVFSEHFPQQIPEFDERFSGIYKGFITSQINSIRNTMVPKILRPAFDESYDSYYQKNLLLLEKIHEIND